MKGKLWNNVKLLTANNTNAESTKSLFILLSNQVNKTITCIQFVESQFWNFIAYMQPFWILHQKGIYVSQTLFVLIKRTNAKQFIIFDILVSVSFYIIYLMRLGIIQRKIYALQPAFDDSFCQIFNHLRILPNYFLNLWTAHMKWTPYQNIKLHVYRINIWNLLRTIYNYSTTLQEKYPGTHIKRNYFSPKMNEKLRMNSDWSEIWVIIINLFLLYICS